LDKQLAGKKPYVKTTANAARVSDGSGSGDGFGWYVNGQGQTMVIVKGPIEFRQGSPRWEPERLKDSSPWHVRRIERSYAIASTHVTVEQWRRFQKDWNVKKTFPATFLPGDNGPVINVTWYEAARYCNWLSEQEGIPEDQWCYPKEIGPGMKPLPDYLSRTGYRLPTEAEVEYTSKAGSQEIRPCGYSLDLAGRYDCFGINSKSRIWPVGQKRPNDLGLFDCMGELFVWCGERWLAYPQRATALPFVDSEDLLAVDGSVSRVVRGGVFLLPATLARSTSRSSGRPGESVMSGVRVCRTYR